MFFLRMVFFWSSSARGPALDFARPRHILGNVCGLAFLIGEHLEGPSLSNSSCTRIAKFFRRLLPAQFDMTNVATSLPVPTV
jgi:hypothetical protein